MLHPRTFGRRRVRGPRQAFSLVIGLAFGLAAGAGTLAAQDPAPGVPNRESALEVRKQFMEDLDTLQVKFLALANAFPADKYAWRPAAGVRSVGEAFMHVASEFYVYTPMAYGAPPSPVIPREKGAMKKFEAMSSKPEVLEHLKNGFAYTKATLGALDAQALTGPKKLFGGEHTIIETSIGMGADLHEHLGQLIAYARMNGITPPWSK